MLVSSLFLTVILYSCGDGSKMHDLDNTIEEAVPLKFDETVEIKVNPVGNKNWFKVDVPEQGYLKVSAQNDPKDLNLACYFAFYEEWADKKTNVISDHLGLPAVIKAEEGTYHFVIRDRWDKKESEEIIPLKVEFIKEFDSFEVNDKSDDAKQVSLNSEFQIAIFPAGDVDWFRVKTDTAGIIKLMSKNIPGGIDLSAEFYEYDEWASPKVNKLSEILSVPCAFAVREAGEYYFKISDRWNKKSAQELMDIKIEFQKETDKYEPNNDFKQAKEIKNGDTLSIAIFPKGDTDFFKITPEVSGKLTLKTKGDVGGIDLISRLYVINPDNPSKLIHKSQEVNMPAEFDVESGVEYFFLFKDRWDKKQHESLFDVKVEIL